MNGTRRYYSREEWARAKFAEPATPKYYESFLHHEGLKCVTDGHLYYLDPEEVLVTPPLQAPTPETPTPAVTASVAVARVDGNNTGEERHSLPDLTAGVDIRFVEISQRLITNDPSYDPVVCFDERYVRTDAFPLQYWQIFCEKDPSGQFLPPTKIFTPQRFVYVWWNGVPPRTVHRNIDLTKEQQEVAIPVGPPRVTLREDLQLSPKEKELQLGLNEGLDHFDLGGLSKDRFRFFEYPHTFIIIGLQVFFATKLRVIPWHNFLHYEGDRAVDFDADLPEEPLD